ncbi:MAG: cysteinyl-tRNA synthetase, partial [Campylobacterota bacterium]|nr:cysteinyl-tRNA synthetase [Campylobacterota bacterium]
VCGPTVYDYSHLGHAKSALSFDLLKRTLKAIGYLVKMARNITDIDDKIINKSLLTNTPIKMITEFYTKNYQLEMKLLGVSTPEIEPKATENIKEMINLIEALLANGAAYKIANNDIYFDTSKDSKYGSLFHSLQNDKQHRVSTEGKKNEEDFVLWKACKEADVCFDSPFGKGRPGWHLECSAMIKAHLADDGEFEIDIHAGGADLAFPHHENESAQTRCAYNQTLAKYWMHNGFININGEKMSKSLGNSFFLKDALRVYHPEVLRFYLLSSHYRMDFNFSEEDLLSSKKRLDKLFRLKKRVFDISPNNPQKEFTDEVLKALCDDLNISIALAKIDEMISNANETLDKNPKDKELKKNIASNIAWIANTLGFGADDAYSYFQHGISKETKSKIELLIEKRAAAKKEKDFKKADEIREELAKMQINIMDTTNGTLWELKN